MREPCAEFDPECPGCQLKAKGVTVPPSALPTRTPKRTHRPVQQPSWEKGRITQKRRGGFEMPVLNSQGKPMTVHEAQSTNVDRRLRELKTGVTQNG